MRSTPEPMLAIASLVLSLVTLVIAAGLLILLRRGRRARAELAKSQHDKALALDRRCDALQHQLDALTRRQRVDHLLDLVSLSERRGRLDADRARHLELYAIELRDQARQTGAE